MERTGEGAEDRVKNMHCWKRHYVAIDTETSGFLPDGRLLEVAAVRCDMAGNVLGTFQAIVCPDDPEWCEKPGAAGALAKNGLNPSFVDGGINVLNLDLWESLFDFITACAAQDGRRPLVVGHNISFDLGILLSEFTRMRKVFGEMARPGVWPGSLDLPLCTLGCDLLLRPGSKEHNLRVTAERWGVPQHTEHRAIGDATTSAGIFAKMLPELPDLDDVLEHADPLRHVVSIVDTAIEKWRAAKGGKYK